MSNKKRKTREQKIKYQQTRLLKIKELQKLRMGIINLEKEIKQQKKNNRIKNLKVCSSTFRRIVMPIVLITGIGLGGCKVINIGSPFKQDKLATVKEMNLEYETDKKFNITEKYIKYWGILGTKTEDGIIKIYNNDSKELYIENLKEKEKIYELFLKNDLKGILEELDCFKENPKLIEEVIEQNKKYVIKCKLNIVNVEDKLYVEESEKNRDLIFLIYCLYFLIGIKIGIRFDKFYDEILMINNNHQISSIKDLKKELSDKKINYLKMKKGV